MNDHTEINYLITILKRKCYQDKRTQGCEFCPICFSVYRKNSNNNNNDDDEQDNNKN